MRRSAALKGGKTWLAACIAAIVEGVARARLAAGSSTLRDGAYSVRCKTTPTPSLARFAESCSRVQRERPRSANRTRMVGRAARKSKIAAGKDRIAAGKDRIAAGEKRNVAGRGLLPATFGFMYVRFRRLRLVERGAVVDVENLRGDGLRIVAREKQCGKRLVFGLRLG